MIRLQKGEQPSAPPDMVWIPGGTFQMGSANFYPEEGPVHDVTVDGFWMDRDDVTNDRFARFVEATGYVTVAERPLNPEDFPGAVPENLVPGSMVFQKRTSPVDLRNPMASRWRTPGSVSSPGRTCSPMVTKGSLRSARFHRMARSTRAWATSGFAV